MSNSNTVIGSRIFHALFNIHMGPIGSTTVKVCKGNQRDIHFEQ